MHYTRESFLRYEPLARENASLPAEIYNQARLLLAHSGETCVFVPIRSLQYQAVIDAEEIIFVDGMVRHLVAVAWEKLHPQARNRLDEAIPFQQVLYRREALEILPRLQMEFALALQQLAEKLKPHDPHTLATVVPLKR